MMLPFLHIALHAEEQESEEVPTVALLEFLGEWQTDDGEWIDPEEMDDEDLAQQLNELKPREEDE